MSFRDELKALIRAAGPLPLARVMALANAHYYAHRPPFGPTGDFVTAPEISQMFGELLGAALADLWDRAGRPPVHLVELGPGRGTLMADLLRAADKAGLRPPVHLVETSPRLRAEQKARLPAATHHDDLASLPDDAPLLVVANEFLDALPLTQFARNPLGWSLRTVALDGDGLAFQAIEPVKLAMVPERLRDAPEGSIFERNFAAEQVAAALARRLSRQGGAALMIDYGHLGPALGDTLQALRGGRFAPPLEALGEGDLSAHVDFAAVAAAAAAAAPGNAPVKLHGPVDQGRFLLALGLRARADRLKAAASLPARAHIEMAVARLTGAGAMGRLFQVMALTGPGWPEPAGFR
ncbi:class I SAM-dependent methyltransferase [Thermaurantiacus sp.]